MRLILLLSFLIIFKVQAQPVYDFIPKEYHLMTAEEKSKLVPPYVGVSFLMENGRYLENKDAAAMKANGGYEQLYYGDNTGNVRIIVSRKLSLDEIQKRKDDYSRLRLESKDKLKELIGKPMPEINMLNLDGSAFSFSETNKPTVLYFWFSSCGECEKLLPEINKLYEIYKDKFNFIAPTLDKKEIAETYLKGKIMRSPKLVSASDLKKHHINFYPTVLVLDKDGNVVLAKDASDSIEGLKLKLYELSKK